jgi:hypothetical protein
MANPRSAGSAKEVEIDETLIGGSVSGKGPATKGNKTCVVGMLVARR